MDVKLSLEKNVLTAVLSGEIDHHKASSIRFEIDEALQRHVPERLIIDFSAVTFMDSSGIGLVMGRCRIMESFGGRVTVRDPNEQVKKVMKLSGVDRLADIESSRKEEAV